MKRLIMAALISASLGLAGIARAQLSGGMMFPGPGTPAAAAGGCTMNGTLDFSGTHTCNFIYYATGVIQ